MRAIIVGAGIGGLTAAAALERQGIECVVLERANALHSLGTGAGLTLQMNAIWALSHIGLDAAVEAAGMVGEWSEFRTWDGRMLARWHEREIGERLGALTVHISRADLHPVLAGAVSPGAVRLGVKCVGIDQDGAGVTATLDDGTCERGEVLIGADGLHSTVRRHLLGEEALRYAGYVVWRGVTEFEHDLLPKGIFRMCWGRGRRFCQYQVANGKLYWFGVEDAPPDFSVPEGGRRAAALASFSGWMDPIADVIRSTPEQAIHLTPIYDRPPASAWGTGRATLLGDAAHPMTFNLGQGACQAIEDAVVLGNVLGGLPPAAGGDRIDEALRHYETRRMARTAAMTNRSWRIGQLGRLRNPLATAVRNTMFRLVFERFVVRGQADAMIVDLSAEGDRPRA